MAARRFPIHHMVSQWGKSLPALIERKPNMITIGLMMCPLAAIGYSMIYLVCGGGLGGAFLIFLFAKMLGR